MKSFLQLVEDQETTHKPVVMSFGRMNPPTTGHLKLIDKVRSMADRMEAKHVVVVSHSQDSKKNPLSSEEKIKHLRRYSPGTNFRAASSDEPTIMHHAAKLHAAGHDHLIVVAGSDRVKEMHDLLHKYNGVQGRHGFYNFKKISVVSAGNRDPDAEGAEGMSGTKMREHAKNNDFSSFREGVPSHVSDAHAKELMSDVRKGMGLNESVNRGMLKAIFVTGGPGSGKDIIIRECIAESKFFELNVNQAIRHLSDKSNIREMFHKRRPVIINGPADDMEKILSIKEDLEQLGYDTLMVFANTTNESSQERNSKLSKMMVESVRHEKWLKSQENKTVFMESFNNFKQFDNSKSIEFIEEEITDTYIKITNFIDSKNYSEAAISWLDRSGKLNVNEKFNMLFGGSNVKKNSKSIQNNTVQKYNPEFKAAGPADIPADNRGSDGNASDLRWNSGKRTRTFTYGSCAGVYAEGSNPTIKVTPQEKESNFSQDNDKEKRKKRGDQSLSLQKLGKPSGIGPEYDTRAGGQGAAAGAGLGNQTYSESTTTSNDDVVNFAALPKGPTPNPLSSDYDPKRKPFKYFRKNIKEYCGSVNDPGYSEMGVGGTLGGASNKEGMDTYKDPLRNIKNDYGIKIKKKNSEKK